jgi:hypothetical protein
MYERRDIRLGSTNRNGLEARGVNDMLIAVVDGLEGFPEAARLYQNPNPPSQKSLTQNFWHSWDGGVQPAPL